MKRLAKKIVKKAIGLIPPSPARLTGTLAKDGGKPVRDERFRPWPRPKLAGRSDWFKVGPIMRDIFCSAQEGYPNQPRTKEFEKIWAEYCGVRHAILLPHGTDALRMALAAALDHDGLNYGGEIIVPNLTFIASANAALDRRVGVALVDVDPATLLLDPRRVEEAIIPGKTRAIMAVHLFGAPCDMMALRDIAKRHKLVLIEDAAQAHGAHHEIGPVGGLGDAGGFSFQSAKNLSSGEGGILTTNNSEIYERAHELHNVGRARVGGARWSHGALGWNCRPTEYIAAVLLHRFHNLENRQQNAADRFMQLHRLLSELPCVEPLAVGPWTKRHGVYMFPMRYRSEGCGGLQIGDFLKAVEAEGIPVSRAYEETLSQQAAYERLLEKHPDYLRLLPTPVADQAVKELIYLSHNLFAGTSADIEEIAAAFRKVQNHFAPSATRKAIGAPIAAKPVAVEAPVKPIRFGIIGVGAMGRNHAVAMSKVASVTLAGMTDVAAARAKDAAGEFSCAAFATPDELMRNVDAVLIATPHWQHVELSVKALEAGLHVVCEKPLAVTVADADEVLRVAGKSRGLFAVVHQRRFQPVYQYAKKLIASGELGAVYRCTMTEATWRSDAYYKSSPWRGTWKGEGGGVLINQAPHLLDHYAWLCGMPETVFAHCDTSLHRIEVEDEASAVLRHANGAHGFIHISTVESPPTQEAVIYCDRGRIAITNGKLSLTKLRDSIKDRTATDPQLWGEVESETRQVNLPAIESAEDLLPAFYADFADAVAGKSQLVCPGHEGLYAVELANAMILSSALKAPVKLPLDRKQYAQFMEERLKK